MSPKKKRFLVQFLLNLAASVFIGISVYGIIIYWDQPKSVSPLMSVGLGLLALLCVFLIMYLGSTLDKLDAIISQDKEENN
ncbi:MAG: hypothetical protein GTN70_09135 [Deltaproteobacteria bacterium]|nr:hypothetical protein [Deltaproteobacteria bacterium]NIS77942.1 hypothetical protein [Deltaproteobacteria bacterium]